MNHSKNILILGSGGREHALAWKISQSPSCEKLYIAPGNPGTAMIGENVALPLDNHEAIGQWCGQHAIDLVVVGPEQPLVDGIFDYFKAHHPKVAVIGPSREAAQLEGSKAFGKTFMAEFGIPTAGYFEAHAGNVLGAIEFMKSQSPPYVLKADGLAAGKGVLIIDDLEEATAELQSMLDGKFGSASTTVVIESFLRGIEFSVFVLTDGTKYCILPEAKDYKRIFDGDQGKNTGGMGAVSPVSFVDEALMNKVKERIILPTIQGLSQRKLTYHGFIFLGLINCGGDPYVIEYNCRLGDPETEVILARLDEDLLELFQQVKDGTLQNNVAKVKPGYAVTRVLASGGYPDTVQKGFEIHLAPMEDHLLFHAGSSMANGKLVNSGGRVFALTSLGDDLPKLLESNRAKAGEICFEGIQYRKDIGHDLLEFLK